MSKPDDRIERAARARFAREWPDLVWEKQMPAVIAKWLREAEADLAAAYPEFHADPPTHWIAPWEASPAMMAAADVQRDRGMHSQGVWQAMRNAHLASADLDKEQKG